MRSLRTLYLGMMPFTFPSHAAAAIPLHRLAPRWLHPAALVVGTCAPDLAYVARVSRIDSHGIAGIVTIGLPGAQGARSTQSSPVMSSVNAPVARSSTPSSSNEPVAPASFPELAVTGPLALKAPVVRSKV